MQALTGLRVLDVGGTVATGYCGKLFADHGADVIDVEPIVGASTRSLAPFDACADAPERSVLHTYLSAHKRSVAIDLDRIEGRALFGALVRNADVVLDASVGDRPLFAELSHIAPKVVLSRITWFGQTGPYRDYAGSDAVCHALIGMLRGIGPVEGPPTMPSGYQAQIVGGLTAYIGTLGHVIGAELGNRTDACALDTSIYEANTCFTDVGAVGAFNTGAVIAGKLSDVLNGPLQFLRRDWLLGQVDGVPVVITGFRPSAQVQHNFDQAVGIPLQN